MFKKYYKAANDDITPKRELIDKIFETTEGENDKKKAKIYQFIPKCSAALAAVLVLIVSVAVYPPIKEYDKKYVSVETTNKKSSIEEDTADTAIYTAEEGNLKEEKSAETVDYSKSTDLKESLPLADVSNEKVSNSRIIAEEQSVVNSFNASENFEILPEDLKNVSNEEVKKIISKLTERFGTVDEETGNQYIFEIIGKAEFSQDSFYIVRWRWFLETHSSLLTTLAVTEDATQIYECVYNGEKFLWTAENNFAE